MAILSAKPVKKVEFIAETTYGTAPGSGSLQGVQAYDFELPALSQAFLDVDTVRGTMVKSKPKVLGVKGGDGPSIKIPCDGLFTSSGTGITEVDDGSGNVTSTVLSVIKTHHKVLHFGSHGLGGKLQGPEAVGTCYTSRGRLCGGAPIASETVVSSKVVRFTVDATAFTQDRFAIGSVVLVESDAGKYLVGITNISGAIGGVQTFNCVGGPATFGTNPVIRPTFSVVLPHGADTSSLSMEVEHYGNSDGVCGDGDHWAMYGVNGNHKIEATAQEIAYSTFEFQHNDWDVSSTQIISGPSSVAASTAEEMIGEDQKVYLNKRTVALDDVYYTDSIAVDAGIARSEAKAVNASQGRRARSITAITPTIELNGYWDRTMLAELSDRDHYAISAIYGSSALGGWGFFAWDCVLSEVPNAGNTNDLLSQKLMFDVDCDPSYVDNYSVNVSQRLAPLVVVYF